MAVRDVYTLSRKMVLLKSTRLFSLLVFIYTFVILFRKLLLFLLPSILFFILQCANQFHPLPTYFIIIYFFRPADRFMCNSFYKCYVCVIIHEFIYT